MEGIIMPENRYLETELSRLCFLHSLHIPLPHLFLELLVIRLNVR
jgi:hypothetical protein